MPRHSGDRPKIKQPTHVGGASGHGASTVDHQRYAGEVLENKVAHLRSTSRKPLDEHLVPVCDHNRLQRSAGFKNDEDTVTEEHRPHAR